MRMTFRLVWFAALSTPSAATEWGLRRWHSLPRGFLGLTTTTSGRHVSLAQGLQTDGNTTLLRLSDIPATSTRGNSTPLIHSLPANASLVSYDPENATHQAQDAAALSQQAQGSQQGKDGESKVNIFAIGISVMLGIICLVSCVVTCIYRTLAREAYSEHLEEETQNEGLSKQGGGGSTKNLSKSGRMRF